MPEPKRCTFLEHGGCSGECKAGRGCQGDGITYYTGDEVAQLIHDRAALRDALADCVVKATAYGTQDDGFVANYIMPTGPIHRAIPLLQHYGITVRPGFDGRTWVAPEAPEVGE